MSVILQLYILVYYVCAAEVSSCSTNCELVYSLTGNSTPGTETRISPSVTVTGIITIEAEYLPNPSSEWEYVRFMRDEDHQPLVIQIYYGEPGVLGKVRLFPEDSTGAVYNGMFSHEQVFTEHHITIQISDLDMVQKKAYQLYLGTPGEALPVTYGYKYATLWEKFSESRISDTTVIKNDNAAIAINSVSICEHAQPALCGGREAVFVAVELGASCTLSCVGTGAPHMSTRWERETRNQTEEEAVETHHNFVVSSEIVIESFSAAHIGGWICYIENKNFGSVTKKTYNLTMITLPENTTYLHKATEDAHFTWTLGKSKTDEIRFNCTGGFPNFPTATTSSDEQEVEFNLVVETGTTEERFECTMYHGDGGVLHSQNITRVVSTEVGTQHGLLVIGISISVPFIAILSLIGVVGYLKKNGELKVPKFAILHGACACSRSVAADARNDESENDEL